MILCEEGELYDKDNFEDDAEIVDQIITKFNLEGTFDAI